MQLEATTLESVFIITPRRIGDSRGWFEETWNEGRLAAAGITADFVQDNHSFSRTKHTLRGLHYQRPPHAQDKLVRCTRGAILDIAVDVRLGSPSYGQSVAVELNPENGKQLWVPKGFLHGFVTLAYDCEVQYKCTDYYDPDCDGGVRWDTLNIEWPEGLSPELSDKDRAAPSFSEWKSPFRYQGLS